MKCVCSGCGALVTGSAWGGGGSGYYGGSGSAGHAMTEDFQHKSWQLTAEANKVFPQPIPGSGGSCLDNGTPYVPPKTVWQRICDWMRRICS